MQLILVRHGEPWAAEAPADGLGADPALSELGHVQARRLADWAGSVAGETDTIAEVVVSPMRRARETAEPVEQALGLAATVGDDLAEYDLGHAVYRPVRELEASGDPEWDRVRAGWFPTFVDAGAFTARVRRGIDAVVARHRGRASALVVCHAGVINTYLAGVLGLERPLTFPLDHVSLTRVLVSRDGAARVRSVNETGHVAGML